MGDPVGVGPEIIAKYLTKSKESLKNYRIVVIGDYHVYQQTEMTVENFTTVFNLLHKFSIAEISDSEYNFLDIPSDDSFASGKISAASGKASMQYLIKATELATKNKVDAIVTAPISKTAINLAGYHYGGHTDYFAKVCEIDEPTMCFWRDDLTVALLTDHITYKSVPRCITQKSIKVAIERLNQFLNKLGKSLPRIGVLCLNPHCGEDGLLGDEEDEVISPAIESFEKSEYIVSGPFTPEIGFAKIADNQLDGLLAMYHDQGITPFKLSQPMEAVNVSLGLPFVRTSVSHGTAIDIAGTGVADFTSLSRAVELAMKLVVDR